MKIEIQIIVISIVIVRNVINVIMIIMPAASESLLCPDESHIPI